MRAARPRAVPLVGLCRAGLRRGGAAGSTSCGARARSTCSAAPISTRRSTPSAGRRRRAARQPCRCSIRCSIAGRSTASSTLCRRHGIQLLCYGTVAGGFLGDRWLGAPEPQPPFENRSLTKYKLIIDDFGGWELFQELLRTLRRDRRPPRHRHRHGRQPRHARPADGGGGHRRRAQPRAPRGQSRASPTCADATADHAEIDAVLARRQGPEGDTFALERDRTGRHGSIMKYNLNTGSCMMPRRSRRAGGAGGAWRCTLSSSPGSAVSAGAGFSDAAKRAIAAGFPDGHARRRLLEDRDAVIAGIRAARGSRPAPTSRSSILDIRTALAGGRCGLAGISSSNSIVTAGRPARRSTALFSRASRRRRAASSGAICRKPG